MLRDVGVRHPAQFGGKNPFFTQISVFLDIFCFQDGLVKYCIRYNENIDDNLGSEGVLRKSATRLGKVTTKHSALSLTGT